MEQMHLWTDIQYGAESRGKYPVVHYFPTQALSIDGCLRKYLFECKYVNSRNCTYCMEDDNVKLTSVTRRKTGRVLNRENWQGGVKVVKTHGTEHTKRYKQLLRQKSVSSSCTQINKGAPVKSLLKTFSLLNLLRIWPQHCQHFQILCMLCHKSKGLACSFIPKIGRIPKKETMSYLCLSLGCFLL